MPRSARSRSRGPGAPGLRPDRASLPSAQATRVPTGEAVRGERRGAVVGSARGAGQRGAATAELAVALPLVVGVLLFGVAVAGAGVRQVALQDAAADASRLLGRGEGDAVAAAAVSRVDPAAGISVHRADDLVCVTASVDLPLFAGWVLPIRAGSCALDGGR
ncbi:pilus assembly protein [Streptomyces sp. MS2A]|nr:pilus assembly protein [Streptomyces sp. MS2A]